MSDSRKAVSRMSRFRTSANQWGDWASHHKLLILAEGATPDRLIPWLNRTPGTAANRRVSRIIELLQKERAVTLYRSLARSCTDAERLRLARLIAHVSESPFELNELLLRYWVSPRLMFLDKGPLTVYFFTAKTRHRVEMGEIGAVMCLTHLGNDIDRVRKCNCTKYFLARRLDQVYCSTKCRVRYHQSSIEFKVKRREYQRAWYHLKKSGKVK